MLGVGNGDLVIKAVIDTEDTIRVEDSRMDTVNVLELTDSLEVSTSEVSTA